MASSNSRYKQNRLQQLRGFCYAARTKSISKAAEKMGLSQPSVSLQIKALERELGAQLFTRRGPRIELTHDGQRLMELARPLVDAIDGLDESFAALRESAERGTVNMAAGGSTIQYLLPPFVEKYTREYPQVDVRLHNVTGKAGLALLREGDVDFAVGPMLDTPPDIQFHPLVTYEPMLITRRDHPLAGQTRVTLKDIAKYPLILPPKNQSTYRVVEMVFARALARIRREAGGRRVRCDQEIRRAGAGDFHRDEPLSYGRRPFAFGAAWPLVSQAHLRRRAAEGRGAVAGGGAVRGNDPRGGADSSKWPRQLVIFAIVFTTEDTEGTEEEKKSKT